MKKHVLRGLCSCIGTAAMPPSCPRGPISGTLLKKELEKPYESSDPVPFAGKIAVARLMNFYYPIGFAMTVIPEGKTESDATKIYALSQEAYDRYEVSDALTLQEDEYSFYRPSCGYSEYYSASSEWAATHPGSETPN
jgi:hypothetical protein